jgi:hypothetical protein
VTSTWQNSSGWICLVLLLTFLSITYLPNIYYARSHGCGLSKGAIRKPWLW